MNGDGDDGAGTALRDHLPNLFKAVQAIGDEINAAFAGRRNGLDPVIVRGPPQHRTGEIPKAVFALIDEADLGIFDVSGRRHRLADGTAVNERAGPNVMYEMALMHSLGIPTLAVFLEGHPMTFYLAHCANLQVTDFSVQTLTDELRATVVNAFQGGDADAASNPISAYYDGLSVVEISSATGLATGHFYNFLRHALNSGESVLDRLNARHLPSGPVKKVIGIRPDSVDSVRDLVPNVRRRAEGKGLALETHQVPINKAGGRDHGIHVCGKYVLDIPTPLSSLVVSPRYRKVRRAIDDQDAKVAARSKQERLKLIATARGRLARWDRAVIDNYFRCLIHEIKDDPACDERLYEPKPLTEVMALIDRAGSA